MYITSVTTRPEIKYVRVSLWWPRCQMNILLVFFFDHWATLALRMFSGNSSDIPSEITQLTFTCVKSTIELLEKGVTYVPR